MRCLMQGHLTSFFRLYLKNDQILSSEDTSFALKNLAVLGHTFPRGR